MPRIAVVAPLTGGVADVGASAVAAARMAVADHGGNAELVVVDDGCDPATGMAAVAGLARDSTVLGVVGHYCSVVALAVTPVYVDAGLPVIVWGAHHVDITERRAGTEIFRLCGTFRHETRATAMLAAAKGWRTFALMRDATPYGREHATLFREAWLAHGGTIVSESDDAGALDGMDALWIAAAPTAWWKAFKTAAGAPPPSRHTTGSFIVAARNGGWRGPIVATAAAMIDADTLAHAGSAAASLYTVSEAHVPADLQGDHGVFAQRYDGTAGAPPRSPYARYAYAATRLLLALLDEGASTRGALRDAVAASAGRRTNVGPVAFDGNGQQRDIAIAAFRAAHGRWRCEGLAA